MQTAGSFGIPANRAVDYNADGEGTRIVYESVSNAVSQCRACATISDEWKGEIDEDYKTRKTNR